MAQFWAHCDTWWPIYELTYFLFLLSLALMFIRFIGLFGQTCLETIVTPMMRTYFNYGDLANSILYLSGGGVLILVFIVLTFASKKFMDRSLILFGLILNIITYIWFLSTVPYYKTGELFLK